MQLDSHARFAQSPDNQRVALRNANRVLVHQVIELGGNGPEVEVSKAATHAVLPDFL